VLPQSNNLDNAPWIGKHAWHTTVKNIMSVNDSGTYLNTSNNTPMQEIQIIAQTTYITDLNKLNGLHILYNAMKPATIIPIDAIVTSCAVVIGTNIW